MSDTPKPFGSTPLPVGAVEVGFSWFDAEVQIRHVINLLETQGDTALAVVKGSLKLIKLATQRDMLGVFAELNSVTVNVQKLVEAIKAEFGI